MASDAVTEICRLMPEFSEAHARWALAVSSHGNALSAMEVLLDQPDDFADKSPPELQTSHATVANGEEQDSGANQEPVTFEASISQIARFHAVLDLDSRDMCSSRASLMGLLHEGDKLVVDRVDENTRMVYFRLYSPGEDTPSAIAVSSASSPCSSPPSASVAHPLPTVAGRKAGGSGAADGGATNAEAHWPPANSSATACHAGSHSSASSSRNGIEQRRRRRVANQPAPAAEPSHLAHTAYVASKAKPQLDKSDHRPGRPFRPPAAKGRGDSWYTAAGDSPRGGHPLRAW